MLKRKLNIRWLAVALCALVLPVRGAETPAPSQVGSTDSETAYFLSSSVPEKELAALMQAAEARHIPVYFRGLINDSVEQTAKAMLYLVTTYHVTGIQVDPVRFDRYGVKQVPALVRKCGEHFDIVYGNVALDEALAMIDERGDCHRAGPNTP